MSSNSVNRLPFDETKKILSELPNAKLKLNREICEEYETWGVDQIHDRRKKLSTRFCEIWPDKNSFLVKISKSKTVGKPIEESSSPLTAHRRQQRRRGRR